ncbi:DoxX family protein [Falsochrobactrum ovis]|uniref:Putative oxidoreductase n=1 Tax=Falsochrobactrum ovis TaxID=1293442 RepID=A0A364JWW2_9HYPH|nr:DoxX family protein [Falsochrobactrum ovis]RAK31086.1 putative oxidoreductase [Falsochrobactrum ovis]
MSATTTANNNSGVLLLARILLALLFIPAGFSKLMALGATTGYFTSIGLPVPFATAIFVGLLELLGGLAVLIGLQTRIAAVLLGVFTIAAAFVGHFMPFDQTGFLKNLAVAGGFFLLALQGPGAISVDAKRD